MVISDQVDTIIWDWNGTLLDDLHTSINTINLLLNRRNLPLLSKERYQEVFTFPIKEYYKRIGFNFKTEPFDVSANEFIQEYSHQVNSCQLHKDAKSVLKSFQKKGFRQLILSAMEQRELNRTVSQLQIRDYFDHLSGLDNHYASSKIMNGKNLFNDYSLQPERTCLIGDTTHDYEVAMELGCQCILIADGHQSITRLQATGCPTYNNLSELIR